MCLGSILLCRPAALLAAAPLVLPALRSVRHAVALAVGAAPFVAAQAWYNLTYLHAAFTTGYGDEAWMFSSPLAEGLPGVLVSPSRGLFVYSPVLVLAPVAAGLCWTRLAPGRRRDVVLLLAGALLQTLLIATWHDWPGGWSYGPRLMTEGAALLGAVLIVTAPVWAGWRRFAAAVVVLATVSVGIHALHVLWPNDDWNAAHEGQLASAAFDWRDPQLLRHLRVAIRSLR
ncbi:MAG: hypothetical protein U0807_01185 [Candidatus Binatia bacterium]